MEALGVCLKELCAVFGLTLMILLLFRAESGGQCLQGGVEFRGRTECQVR